MFDGWPNRDLDFGKDCPWIYAANGGEYNGVDLMFRDLLDLTDPLRHALERTTVLGEDYTLARPPPILEEDIAAARAVEERIAGGLPEVLPKLL